MKYAIEPADVTAYLGKYGKTIDWLADACEINKRYLKAVVMKGKPFGMEILKKLSGVVGDYVTFEVIIERDGSDWWKYE